MKWKEKNVPPPLNLNQNVNQNMNQAMNQPWNQNQGPIVGIFLWNLGFNLHMLDSSLGDVRQWDMIVQL